MRTARVLECAGRAQRHRRFGFPQSGTTRHNSQHRGQLRRMPKRRRASLVAAVQDGRRLRLCESESSFSVNTKV